MAGLALVSGPGIEPVTIDEAKLFSRITVDDEDALIEELITAARQALEERWNWSFITQTWDQYLDQFPANDWHYSQPIVTLRGPLQSVTSVKYTPNGGSIQTVSSADYYVDATNSCKPKIVPVIGKAWPGDLLRIANGVEVRIVTGYASADAVPFHLKVAVKQLVNAWYVDRDSMGHVPDHLDAFLEEVRGGVLYA